MPATTTVQARAFRAGWTPSAVTSSTLTIVNGTLATPTADPPGGIYQPAETVSLSGPAGANLRYTTDGSEPSAVSDVYMGPLTFAAGTVALKAKAFQAGWLESATMSAAYTFDDVPPTVRVDVFPYPINGWHSGPVTVTFVCSDSAAMASCPAPTTVIADGDTTVSGTAIDVAGNSTPASVTIHIDTTAPEVALTSPTADLTTTDTTLTLSGTVSDALSGLNLVQCNGDAATVAAGVATCTAPLRPGRNSVVLMARDAAGHVTSRGIRVTRTGVTTALSMTPTTRTLLVNEVATMSLFDDFGATISAATWTSSDATVIGVSTDDPPMLKALAAGTATITATKNGQSATATITVIVGTTLPDGTTRWTVPTTPSTTLGTTIYSHRVTEDVPDLFITEKAGTGTYAASYTVQAAMGDGTIRWREAVPGVPVFGDEEGGLVVALGSDDAPANYISGFARVAGPDAAVPWRYASPGWLATGWVAGGFPAPARPEVAQGPDGTIYVTELPDESWRKYLLGLDGATGQVKFRVPLPRSRRAASYLDGTGYDYEEQTSVSAPVIGEDGAAYVQASSTQDIETQTGPGTGEDYERQDLTLVRVTPTGQVTETLLWSYEQTNGGLAPSALVGEVVPDTLGGVLARWTLWDPQTAAGSGRVSRVVGSTTTEFVLPSADDRITMVGDAGVAFVVSSGGLSTYAVDVATWTTVWTAQVPGVPIIALDGGGVVLADASAGTLQVINELHAPEAAIALPVSAPQSVAKQGEFIGTAFGGAAAATGPVFTKSWRSFASVIGGPSLQGQTYESCVPPPFLTQIPPGPLVAKSLQPGSDVTYKFDSSEAWTNAKQDEVRKAFRLWTEANLKSGLQTKFREVLEGPSWVTVSNTPIPDNFFGQTSWIFNQITGWITSATITFNSSGQGLLTESDRNCRRAHSERGWSRWQDRASIPESCESVRSGWSSSTCASTRRSGRRSNPSPRNWIARRRSSAAGCARPSVMPDSGLG